MFNTSFKYFLNYSNLLNGKLKKIKIKFENLSRFCILSFVNYTFDNTYLLNNNIKCMKIQLPTSRLYPLYSIF